jgi:hypothetical protein
MSMMEHLPSLVADDILEENISQVKGHRLQSNAQADRAPLPAVSQGVP